MAEHIEKELIEPGETVYFLVGNKPRCEKILEVKFTSKAHTSHGNIVSHRPPKSTTRYIIKSPEQSRGSIDTVTKKSSEVFETKDELMSYIEDQLDD